MRTWIKEALSSSPGLPAMCLLAVAAAAPQASAAPSPAPFDAIVKQLARPDPPEFTLVLQDASDENNSMESMVKVHLSDVAADAAQCRLSYRQKVDLTTEAGGTQASDRAVEVSLRDVESIKAELFEKYENEWEGKPGFVYTQTYPQMTAVVIVHPEHVANWFVLADASAAQQLADALNEAARQCKGSS